MNHRGGRPQEVAVPRTRVSEIRWNRYCRAFESCQKRIGVPISFGTYVRLALDAQALKELGDDDIDDRDEPI